jgi:hypothetical protein
MPLDSLTGDLIEAAFESLAEKFKEDNSGDDSVKLIVDHAIGDVFSFVLYSCGDHYRWERKICYKQKDISKLSHPVERLKYLVQKIVPGIIEQQGLTELKEAAWIFSSARSLLALDSNEKADSIVIDGTKYLLQTRFAGAEKEFSWNAVSGNRTDVEIIACKIIELNNQVY